VSVLVPVSERPEPLAEFYNEYASPLRAGRWEFEFVFIAEPGFQHLTDSLAELIAGGEPIRVLGVGQTVGGSSLLKLAAAHCRGAIVVTLPAYRRVEAASLPALVREVEQGADMAVALRQPRRDSWVNRIQTRVLHALIGRLGSGRLHDVASGVAAMRLEVLRDLPLYGDFFRFLPLLALHEGYRVEEVPSPQHSRDVTTRVYGPGVYLRRLVDVLGLFFLLRFTDKPLRFFGLVGSGLSLAGATILVVVVVQRFQGRALADRPMFLLAVLVLVLGVQAIALGLIGEIIVHHATRRRTYRLLEPASSPPSRSGLPNEDASTAAAR